MKKFIFLILILSVSNCTVKYIKKSPNWDTDFMQIKRLVVDVSHESNIDSDTKSMVASMSESYLSHHKEFIIYPFEKSDKNPCGKGDSNVKNVMLLTVMETKLDGKLELSANGKVLRCADSSVLWEGLAANSYRINPAENLSLVRTYTQKIGPKIADKVTPYFVILQALLERLDSPTLTEDEKDEKIEVEAR